MVEISKAFQYLAKLQSESISPKDKNYFIYNTKRRFEDYIFRRLFENQGPLPYEPILESQFQRREEVFQKMFADLEATYLEYYLPLKSIVPDNQSIVDYKTLNDAKQKFDRIVKDPFQNSHLYNTSSKVYFGTLETSTLDALIFPVPECDEYLIILNRGLWNSTMTISYLISMSLDFGVSPTPVNFNQAKATAQESLFKEILKSLLQGGSFDFEPPIDNSRRNFYWEELDQTIKDFIFGHEYGHFLHSHFDGDTDTKSATVVFGNVDYNSTTSWANEYEADRTALDLTIFKSRALYYERAKERSKILKWVPHLARLLANKGILMGVEGSLVFLNLLRQVEQLNGTIFTPESSHPPTWLRILRTWSDLGRQIPAGPTRKQFTSRLRLSVRCLDFFFDRYKNPLTECSFQGQVLQSLFQHTHVEIISELKGLHKTFQSYSGKTKDTVSFTSQLTSEWYELLKLMIKFNDGSPAQCVSMIENCILILEKNLNFIHKR